MKKRISLRQRFFNDLPNIILAISLCLFLATAYFISQWWQANKMNIAYADQSILQQTPSSKDHLHAYNVGYLLAADDKPEAALEAFDIAEASKDPHLRSLTKYAMANLHSAVAEGSIEGITADSRLVGHILLAREAYKGALRIEPDFYAARFNLERLDRISPEKRSQGFIGATSYTIGLDPFKESGRALMKDNTRRGLP